METLYLLIPVSVLLVFFIGWAFWWSVRNGQFDDLEGPAYRMLMDDEKNDAANDAAKASASRTSVPAADAGAPPPAVRPVMADPAVAAGQAAKPSVSL